MQNLFSLEGKVALVTGAAYGIGFAIAEALAKAGAEIAFNCRGQEHMDKALADYEAKGIKAHGYLCDVTNEDDVKKMVDQIDDLKGIDMTASIAKLSSQGITEDMMPDDIKDMVDNGKYQIILLSSKYDTATDQLNSQIAHVSKIAKSYDKHAIVAGEGPLMRDMVTIADTDFTNVNSTSIGVVFVIMLFVLKSISLPVLLVLAIEFAIFINMGIPFMMGTKIPFVASIVIGTIQLGATIDYAILMSTKYLEIRQGGGDKVQAVSTAMDASLQSIFVSALCFFAATVGVGIYSSMDMISTICSMISRGALISMIDVAFIAPSLLLVFDTVIAHTSLGFKKKGA